MIDPRHPHYPYQQPRIAAPPPRPRFPPLLIGLLVVAAIGTMGMFALAAAGAVWYFASQRSEPVATPELGVDGATSAGAPVGADGAGSPPLELRADNDGEREPTNEAETPSADDDARELVPDHDQPPNADGVAGGTEADEGSSADKKPEPDQDKGGAAKEGNWWCTASASVRVCGFAGACNYQMVFGNGGGKDRFLASQQAKNACQRSAMAKGATAVCVVQCSLR